MANPTSRTRGTGSPGRRTMTAAARAAAKRAARQEEDAVPGRTLLVEPLADGWEHPPEPAPEPFEDVQEESRPSRRAGRSVLTAVPVLALVAALVLAAVLGWQYRQGRQAEQARGEALAAAREAAPVVLSYDYRHLDRDFARARALLTGHFRDQYGRTTKTVVAPTATTYHAVVKATVATPSDGGTPAASVVSAAPDKAVVLLFVNQVTQSTQVPEPRLDLNRVRLTLTRTSDGWKVSGVDAL
ncbi:hypothetical protein ACIRVK_29270 [Streptomyces sp. NPDC101152]|uniref:hypothetical protein n=1 Tax=Streptomyces sp. NPDC101152 TaxID=3366116 RepID=UPI00381A6B77